MRLIHKKERSSSEEASIDSTEGTKLDLTPTGTPEKANRKMEERDIDINQKPILMSPSSAND